ncbi:MAG: response regulator [Pirellulales bacterium]|nr:response regulator [Pirellulales bacterium]
MMAENPSLLVVDDEEVVCQACRRIFSRQGFQVEVNTDARQGLALATEKDYGIILLDIKMPNLDGIHFLERLREKKPDVPVLIITGYPSIPNAAAAMRLGACDYITKPFTSEEIIQAVHRVMSTRSSGTDGQDLAQAAAVFSAATTIPEAFFWEESWFRLEVDGSACMGAVLPGISRGLPTGIRLPRIGEVVYQGLPLAGVTMLNQPLWIIPAPLSGVVMEINEALHQHLGLLAEDPCGEGWIACLCTTRQDEAKQCRQRRILLVNADPASAGEQARKLTALGCLVQTVADRESLLAALEDKKDRVVFLDAASFGDAGPELAGLIGGLAPAMRIVVVASAQGAGESAYRKQKIFYYAVEPFTDNEIADILTAAFRVQEPPPGRPQRPRGPAEPISSITITNRNGHKVQLLAAPGLLWRNEGLGSLIGQALLERDLPVVMTPGEASRTPANILKAATACDRLMVLLARDSGLIQGSLTRDTKPEFDVEPGEAAGKVTMLAVQPDMMGGLAGLDQRTTAALAQHLVSEMMSY